ncbi:MAG: CRTAC1 family protein [Pirellulales bacterium]
MAWLLISPLAIGCEGKAASSVAPAALPASPVASSGPKEGSIRLVNVTHRTGIEFVYENGREAGMHAILESLGGGVGLFDYDNDGRLDLFCLGGGRYLQDGPVGLPSALFRNLGDWKFDDVTAPSAAGGAPHYTHGCSAADYDADGFVDVLVTGYGGLLLLHNQGDGTFVEVSGEAGLDDRLWSSAAAWGDLNGDGHLDLYVAHYVDWSMENNPECLAGQRRREICPPKEFNPLPDSVYYSNGDGTFYDATSTAGLRPDGKGLGLVLADLDHDGDLDVYVANDTVDNFFYINDGRGVFEEEGMLRGVACGEGGNFDGSMGLDLCDFNGDLLPDLWVANFEEESFALYRNELSRHELIGTEAPGFFVHVSRGAGITALGTLFVGFGTVAVDVDKDGDEDFVVSNGHVINFPRSAPIKQLPLMLLNHRGDLGEPRFWRHSISSGGYFEQQHRGRGLAAGDLDDDGDIDLVFSHDDDEPVALVRNNTAPGNDWLRVRLIGRASNRDAIGARLVLTTATSSQLRHVKGGCSYLSQSDLRPFWGLGKKATIESLSIVWPSGIVQELTSIEPNQTLTLVEPDPPGPFPQ